MRTLLIAMVLGSFAAAGCSDDKPAETEKLTPKACTEGGNTHASGSSWTCSDGCNSCGCADGVVSQTSMACVDAEPPFQVDSTAPGDTNAPADTATTTDTSASDATDAADGG
jgi:predicted  nucleic acid-binding Zn-ribbon protein